MPRASDVAAPVLSIDGLTVEFPGKRVVDDVTLRVDRGEIVALIGESGSGKTLTALAVLGLLPRRAGITSGRVHLGARSLLDLRPDQRRDVLGDRLAFIPQDAMRALNPTIRVGDQVGEPLVLHRASPWVDARRAARALLEAVHLKEPDKRIGEYPHQFSGGMQQRAMIAMGLALEPELLIADEPTTALDVTVQAQVIRLLEEIRSKHGTSILFITHDLGLVADFCDRVYVMYAGQIVEEGPVAAIFDRPRHPYTAALLAATPSAATRVERLDAIPGQIPSAGDLPPGCLFQPRCAHAQPTCLQRPVAREIGTSHRVRCFFPMEAT